METEEIYPRLELSFVLANGFSNLGMRVTVMLREYFKNEEGKRFSKKLTYKEFYVREADAGIQIVRDFEKELDSFLTEKINKLRERRSIIYTFFDLNSTESYLQFINQLNLKTPLQQLDPIVIQFSEKHSTRTFVAKTPEEAKQIYLNILTERYDEKWYDWMKEDKPYLRKPDFSLEEVDSLPTSMATTKAEMLKKLENYNKEEKRANKSKDKYAEIKQVINNQDGANAFYLLQEMKGSEYEDFEIINPEEL